jgi:FPC/CPF motif-containing protein YcgG
MRRQVVILKTVDLQMTVDEMKKTLKEILAYHGEKQTNLAADGAQNLIVDEIFEHVSHIVDENESLWEMLDEIKASDVKNYSKEFRKMMDRKLVDIKMLANMKPEQA